VEVFAQPQETWFELNGLLTPATHPLFGDYWQPPAKVTFASAPAPRLRGAAIGEHTAPLLAELGYSAEVIDRLRTEKVIGCWSEPGAGRAA
jgi:crotonobetainyl-CoA:carnitine CoA-transferase CaiB-like acyl-CoA transferase